MPFADLLTRLRSLVFRRQAERELSAELEDHLARDTADRIRRGQDPATARREARMALGGVEQTKELVRDARGTRLLEDLGGDLRYALRGLRRNPGFTLTAVLVLGLGLGATTAVFSVVRAVVLAPLPYREPERLMLVAEQNPTNTWAISTADALAIREQQKSFSVFGVLSAGEAALSGAGPPERIATGRATSGFFQALEVGAARGRLPAPEDEAQGAPPVVVVSHSLAMSRLGGPGAALGKSLVLDGVSHQVIGVLPEGLNELSGVRAQAWPALKFRPPTFRGPFWLRGLGRLRPGATLESATADLAGVSRHLLTVWGGFDTTARLTPIPLQDQIVGRATKPVGLFAGAVALVLLLAITNVATLVLVRASAREPEVAVRYMLGAARTRITRLLLTENFLLTLAAAAAGLLLASFGVKLATAMLPNLPRIQSVTLDWRAVTFAVVAALISGVLVSLSPVAALSGRASSSLRADARRVGAGKSTNALRSAFVMAEFALALPLLVGAGLLLNSFVRLSRVDPGFDPVGVVAVTVSLPAARYPGPPEIQRFWQLAEQRLTAIPGASAFGLSSELPPDQTGNNDNFNLMDHPVPVGQSEPNSPWYYVTTGYFAALGVPMLEGRGFTVADSGNADPVIVVSRAWANKYFPGEQAVGRKLVQGGCYDCPRTSIVGVVGDIRNLGLAATPEAVYGPVTQTNTRRMSLVVRTAAAPASGLRALTELVGALDTELPTKPAVVAESYRESLGDPRRWSGVLTAFAIAGVALAALGIFGLMSYVVRQRRREIGVRLALGAEPRSVTRLIVGRGMRYAAIGSGVGLGLTVLLTRKLGSLLFGVSPTDALTIGGVAVLLLGVALVACWVPGRRAGRIKPLEAISTE